MNRNTITRYTAAERANHWVVAITFVLLAVSGLALFHPAMYWLTALLGGGPWTRILHPFIGMVMALSFAGLALRMWRHNYLGQADRKWLSGFRSMLGKHEERLPEVGRYNGGQKLLFFIMVACVALLLLSGFAMWRPYFAPTLPIGVVRMAAVVHAFAAWMLMIATVIHVYAAIWVKGTLRGMLQGTVTQAWAKKHHMAWYRQVTGGGR